MEGRVDIIKTHKILKEPIKNKDYYCPLPRLNTFVILELKIKSIKKVFKKEDRGFVIQRLLTAVIIRCATNHRICNLLCIVNKS